jgi:hypothetical protein
MTEQKISGGAINSSQPTGKQGNPQDEQIPYMHGIPIEPIYDFEVELWFAGVLTGLPSGPWSQRNSFYAFPSLDGSHPGSAEAYTSKHEAELVCISLRAMSRAELLAFAPNYFVSSSNLSVQSSSKESL